MPGRSSQSAPTCAVQVAAEVPRRVHLGIWSGRVLSWEEFPRQLLERERAEVVSGVAFSVLGALQ